MTEFDYAVAVNSGVAWVELAYKSGSITMDEGWAPYLQSRITIATPEDDATLTLLDPRGIPPRLRVIATQISPAGTTTREFRGYLRSRQFDHVTNETVLDIASGESLLQDLTQKDPAQVKVALGFQNSVRSIINSTLLNQLGTALQPGTADADFTTLSAVTNLIPNPSAESDLSGVGAAFCTVTRTNAWAAPGAGSWSFQLSAGTSADSYFDMAGNDTALRLGMRPGGTYTASATLRLTGPLSGTVATYARTIRVVGANAAGQAVELAISAPPPNAAGVYRVSVTFTIPPTYTGAALRFYLGATGGTVWWDALMLVEGDGKETNGNTALAYFDGNTPDTGLYNYDWSGAANVTNSKRTPVFQRDPQSLWWPIGTSGWAFISPVLTQAGLRLFCDEQERWWLVNSSYLVDGLTTLAEGYNAVAGTDTIARDGDEWCEAVVVKYTWNDTSNVQQVKYDVATITPPYTEPLKTMTVEYDSPYPGPGAAAYILKKQQGRGRVLDLRGITDLSATPTRALTATLPDTPVQSGVTSRVDFDMTTDEMQIKTRGLTDTPPDSWLAVPDAQTWATIPGDPTWATWTP